MAKADREEPPVAAFNPRLLEVTRRPPSPRPRLLLGLLLALVATALVWAAVGRLDVVVRAQGQLVPRGRLKIVQPFERGRVEKLLVAEGDRVEAGDLLAVMDTRLVDADLHRVNRSLDRTRLELRRIRSQLQDQQFERQPGDPAGLFSQIKAKQLGRDRSFEDKIARTRSQLARARQDLASARATHEQLQQTLPILERAEQALGGLEKKGYTSTLKLLDRRRARIRTQQELEAQGHRVQSAMAQIDMLQAGARSLESGRRKGLLDQRVKLASRLEELVQQRRKLRHRRELMKITAPEAGVIEQLAIHTPGSVVSSGTVLMRLVPSNDPLQAEVFVANSDVGFVHPGETARIKLSAFDFQRFGTIEARVKHLSPDAGGDPTSAGDKRRVQGSDRGGRYSALLRLARQHMMKGAERLDLRAGMHVTAEIKLGTRSVLEYFLSPITEGLKEAGRQR